jgi:arylsulfatase A-like enzyme
LQNSTDQLVTDTFARYIRAAYMGAVSYMDNNFGVVLDALEASGTNTAVVLFGDHGWHLGERNNWEKKALYEI